MRRLCWFTLVTCLLTGCHRAASSTPSTGDAKPKSTEVTVRTVKPARKTVQHVIEQPGFNIEAFQETPLHVRIAGYVLKWNVDLGDHVKRNDVLAELHVPDREVELKQREASVRHVAAQIEQAKAALLTMHAQVERTKSQYERLAKVGQSGVLDRESVDEARLGYDSAKANLEKTKADVTVAEANLEVAKSDRDYTKTMLQYAKIVAPFDGVVTQRNVKQGDFVQPAGKGEPLYVISQLDPIRVLVNVPAIDAAWVKDGDPVTLRLQGTGGEVLQGKITRNARALNPQARTLRVEIDVPNKDEKLLPGMYVHAAIKVHRPDVWTIPVSALLSDGDTVFCYRVEQNKAVRTPLQIGLRGDGLVEVRKQRVHNSSGDEWQEFTGAEEIVVNSSTALNDEQPVHIDAAK